MKKNMFKKTAASLAVLSACLLVAAAPLSPAPVAEEPGETIEAGADETEPGIQPQNDDVDNEDVTK